MLKRRNIKQRSFEDPTTFYRGSLWIPISAFSILLFVLFTTLLVLEGKALVQHGKYAAIALITLLDVLFAVGAYYVISDGAARVRVGRDGVSASYFGKQLCAVSWAEVYCIYVQHETSRGTDKFILLAKAGMTAKELVDAARLAKHGVSTNPNVLFVIPYKEKRTQMLRQFAPQRVDMRYLQKIKR